MATVSEQVRREFHEQSREAYDTLRLDLEDQHPGAIIGLDPASREYVLGQSIGEVSKECQERFGEQPVYITRIGGGSPLRHQGGLHGRPS